MISQETASLLLLCKSLINNKPITKKLQQCDNWLWKMIVKRNNMADNLCEDVRIQHHHQLFDTLSLFLWLSWSLVSSSGFFPSGLFLFFFNLWFLFWLLWLLSLVLGISSWWRSWRWFLFCLNSLSPLLWCGSVVRFISLAFCRFCAWWPR